ncbi:MAG: tetratricopeptide repeat protein [Gemmataceae bacterium]|nr:tetratricopeptide repeat protein [Gemmata sp.]MDW8198503.1 tetratricopeptide repeat protein [Gemmataceae bacterium]
MIRGRQHPGWEPLACPQTLPTTRTAMSEQPATNPVPTPTAEQRRIAHENFTKAKQLIAEGGYDYAIELLLTCCRLHPANLEYRRTLRKTQKDKYGNNLRGSRLAFLTTPRWKAKLKVAKRNRDYLKALEYAEQVLCRNPWDLGTQMDMAEVFDALGLSDLAVFTLDQARQKYPKDPTLNRALARQFEKRGDFQGAMVLWQLVREAIPTDVEAAHKAKDLAASATIQKGQYEEAAAGTKESPVLGRIEARAVEKQDKLAREAEPLLKRIEADPTEPALYLQLASVYRRHGQPERARDVLQRGLGPTGNAFPLQLELLELDLAPVRKNLEHTEARIRKWQGRAATTETDAPTSPDPDEMSLEELHALRAKLLKEINAREIELFRMKADRFPNDYSHRIELGIRLYHADRIDEAIAELQQARRDERLKWRAALWLGLCFKKRNNWRLAQRNFEEGLAAVPDTEEATKKELLFQLASGAAENGDWPRALDLGHELANLDFNFKNIGKLLDEWNDRLQSA